MPFRFRRQPLKTVSLIVGAISILIRLPVWTARNILPSWRARKEWNLTRALFVELVNAATAIMFQTSLPTPDSLHKLSLLADQTGFVWVDPSPDLIVGDIQRFAEMNEVAPAPTAASGEKVIYHLHGAYRSPAALKFLITTGGGFVTGSGSPSFLPIALTIQGILEHAPQIPRAFALEYRLASGAPFPTRNPFPTALIDVIAGYNYLIHKIGFSPYNVIVSGDSAGGVLAYQLARHLATAKIATLHQAGALLLLSPSADSGLRAPPGDSMQTNRRADYVRTWFDAGYVPPTLLGALPAAELDRPWLSPGSPVLTDADTRGIFEGFPQTFILAGEAEMSRDSMRTLRDRMRADMGEDKVKYVEVTAAPHDFLGMKVFEPERTVGLKAVGDWVGSL